MRFEGRPTNTGDRILSWIVRSFEPSEVGIPEVTAALERVLIDRIRHAVTTPGGPSGAAGFAINTTGRAILRELLEEGTAGDDVLSAAINFLILQATQRGGLPRPNDAAAVFDALVRQLSGELGPAGGVLVDPMHLVDP